MCLPGITFVSPLHIGAGCWKRARTFFRGFPVPGSEVNTATVCVSVRVCVLWGGGWMGLGLFIPLAHAVGLSRFPEDKSVSLSPTHTITPGSPHLLSPQANSPGVTPQNLSTCLSLTLPLILHHHKYLPINTNQSIIFSMIRTNRDQYQKYYTIK